MRGLSALLLLALAVCSGAAAYSKDAPEAVEAVPLASIEGVIVDVQGAYWDGGKGGGVLEAIGSYIEGEVRQENIPIRPHDQMQNLPSGMAVLRASIQVDEIRQRPGRCTYTVGPMTLSAGVGTIWSKPGAVGSSPCASVRQLVSGTIDKQLASFVAAWKQAH